MEMVPGQFSEKDAAVAIRNCPNLCAPDSVERLVILNEVFVVSKSLIEVEFSL